MQKTPGAFSLALQEASPLLLSMGQSLLANQGVAPGIQYGMAAMMKRDELERQRQMEEEDRRLRLEDRDWRRSVDQRDYDFRVGQYNDKRADRQAGIDATTGLFRDMMGGPMGQNEAMGRFGGPTNAASDAMGFPASLIRTESGGNWNALNDISGAGGHKGHGGRLQFGTARLADAARAGVVPAMTAQEFAKAPPEVQRRVEQWHFSDIDQGIRQRGLDQFIGQNIGGVTITQDGIRAMAHLGGIAGADKFLKSGGRYNPADAFGTSLKDYARTHAGNTPAPRRNMTPERFAQIMNSPAVAPAVKQMVLSQVMPEQQKMSAKEAQVSRLMEAGYDRVTAIRIADGAIVTSRDPLTGEVVLVDKGGMMPAPNQQPPSAPQVTPETPAAQPPAAPTDTPNSRFSFGLPGMAGSTANYLFDMAGLGEPFSGIAEGRRFFDANREQLTSAFAAAYPRMPAEQRLKAIESLFPQGGDGPDGALGKVRAQIDSFERNLDVARKKISRGVRPGDRSTLLQNMANIESGLQILREMEQRLIPEQRGQAGGNTTSSGVTWSVEE